MTKLIWVLIILVVIFVGYRTVTYWQNFENEKDLAPTSEPIRPERLPGMPDQFQRSLDAAYQNGATGLKQWLDAYGSQIQDPRLAWIQLDYCVLLVKTSPKEAQQLFGEVKDRTPTSSPVYARVKQLERSFE